MAKKSAKDFVFEIKIPEGIEADIEKNTITMRKDGKELRRDINEALKISKEDGKLILFAKKARKDEKKVFGTARGHIRNMIDGLTSGFEYELEVCNIHFPITVSFDKAKSEFMIKNLLGEKSPRTIKVSEKIEAEVKMPRIKIKSYDIEAAGQAAANLEKITKIRYRDRNKFQDGIFIIKKPGVEYL